MEYTFLYKQLGSCSSPQSCLYFHDFQDLNFLNCCLVFWPNKQTLSIFQRFFSIHHWHFVYRQSSFFELRRSAIRINVMVFNRANRKQLNILKVFLEYPKFHVFAFWFYFFIFDVLSFSKFKKFVSRSVFGELQSRKYH